MAKRRRPKRATLRKLYPSEYTAWRSIKHRCFNPRANRYHYYGGRGITMCEEWRGDFKAFLFHVGRKPGPEYSIDRIDNDGNYEPGNVRWATPRQQANNRRPGGPNVRLMTLFGRTETLSNWAVIMGLTRSTLKCRVHQGWSDEDALLTPANCRRGEREYVALYQNSPITMDTLAEMSGFAVSTLYTRLWVGWTLVEAISIPRGGSLEAYRQAMAEEGEDEYPFDEDDDPKAPNGDWGWSNKPRLVTCRGVTLSLKEWADALDHTVSYDLLSYRARAGWADEDIIMTPGRVARTQEEHEARVENFISSVL